MSPKPHSTVEQALRSLRCALLHLNNAKNNAALAEEVVTQEILSQVKTGLEAAYELAKRA